MRKTKSVGEPKSKGLSRGGKVGLGISLGVVATTAAVITPVAATLVNKNKNTETESKKMHIVFDLGEEKLEFDVADDQTAEACAKALAGKYKSGTEFDIDAVLANAEGFDQELANKVVAAFNSALDMEQDVDGPNNGENIKDPNNGEQTEVKGVGEYQQSSSSIQVVKVEDTDIILLVRGDTVLGATWNDGRNEMSFPAEACVSVSAAIDQVEETKKMSAVTGNGENQSSSSAGNVVDGDATNNNENKPVEGVNVAVGPSNAGSGDDLVQDAAGLE